MKTKSKIMLCLGVLLLSSHGALSESLKKVPSCASSEFKRYFIEGIQVSPKDLPKSILIARNAQLYYEDLKGGELKFKAFQSFTSPESKIECATPNPKIESTLSFSAPVLLDLSGNNVVGNSVWQFNLIALGQKVGLWNQASQLLSKTFKLEEWLTSNNDQITFYQINHDQFEMVVRLADRFDEKILVIVFDSVKGL